MKVVPAPIEISAGLSSLCRPDVANSDWETGAFSGHPQRRFSRQRGRLEAFELGTGAPKLFHSSLRVAGEPYGLLASAKSYDTRAQGEKFGSPLTPLIHFALTELQEEVF